MPVHKRIAAQRRKLGITLIELAERLHPYLPGLDHTDLSRIETGRRAVKADELPYFAKALQCNIEDLLDPKPSN